MAATLQVLLLENTDTLGQAGDIVTVPEGYARNFLFPNGKAALATKQVQQVKSAKEMAAKKHAQEELEKYQEIAERMENSEMSITAKVKDGDEIFGSILPKVVVERLHSDSNISVPLKNIKGPFPLKKLGNYDVTVQLGQGVEFHMAIVVIPDGNEASSEKDDE